MESLKQQGLVAAIVVCLLATSGCLFATKQTTWYAPEIAPLGIDVPDGQSSQAFEEFYTRAVLGEEQGDPSCVDNYYQAAATAWACLERDLIAHGGTAVRTAQVYRSSVDKLLITGQRFGRWNPSTGMTVVVDGQTIALPVKYEGFVWSPHEFQQLVPCGRYDDPRISRQFRSEGLGATLVVVRHTASPQPFTQKIQPFAASVILRANQCGQGGQGGELEFYDPLRVGNTCVANRPVALARDITAPLAYASLGNDREWITDFLQPGTNNAKDGLMMIEPYQPGKIPVLMVHGLLSDPSTWADLANELRAHPDLNDRYQWWAFRYASGEPFLRSAGELRRQLVEVRETYDPQRRDPALSQIVVVGHSMGGLIAKLQVTESGDRLWNSTAKIPLASVRTSEQTRQQLQSEYFFRPSSDITRVVFIGTPHQGSVWAQRPVGRIASAMVETPPEREAQFKQVMRDNPGASRNISDGRFPTSIDLLKPSNELLVATAQLPYSDRVRVHSIIGTRRTTWKGEPSDGVVPVSSARLLNVTSEKLVDEVHTDLQRNPESVAEVIRILRIHLAERDFDSHESASMVGSIVTAQ